MCIIKVFYVFILKGYIEFYVVEMVRWLGYMVGFEGSNKKRFICYMSFVFRNVKRELDLGEGVVKEIVFEYSFKRRLVSYCFVRV